MTTAREKADGWCYDWTKADGSLTRKKAAGDLIEIIQQVFAELREKEKEGCGSNSPAPLDRSVSSSAQAGSATLSLQSEGGNADDWEPSSLPTSHSASPTRSGTTTDTTTDAPTESSTPSPKSGASSLDERAEALFAANPGWRPRSNDQSLSLQFHEGHWTWLSINWFSVDPSPATANAHLLAALLPRAIEEWAWFRCTEAAPEFVYRSKTVVPRDLESAIRVLEGT